MIASTQPRPIFGELLRNYRLAAALTQESLAERAGVSVRGIQKLEAGESRPYRDTTARLAAALVLVGDDLSGFVVAAQPAPRTQAGHGAIHLLPDATNRDGMAGDRARHLPSGSATTLPLSGESGKVDSFPVPTLPVALTSFVGREREIEQVCRLLDSHRLVTLVGPPGTGKTRLAIETAAAAQHEFADGIFFVPLAAQCDPTLVFASIAQCLGIQIQGERSAFDRFADALPNKRLLLVLDNFEQIVSAAIPIVQLLTAVPGPKILVTSRVALNVRGEQIFPVAPLAVPDPACHLHVGAELGSILPQYPSIQLFVDRAQAVRPDFCLTRDNVEATAEVCRRLDGLPLAIELAAARSTILSPTAMLTRLAHRLPLLTRGAQDLPPRQQTLDAAIAWSYNLLDSAEQSLFRCLAIFVGGWDAASAAAVCLAEDGIPVDSVAQASIAGSEPPDVLDRLESLVRKSLIQTNTVMGTGVSAEPRFGMLETLRDYAVERLIASGELEALRRQHAAYFLALAEQTTVPYWDASDRQHHDQLEVEHDNLRLALQWFSDQAEPEQGFRLSRALANFWYVRGYLTEGQSWLDSSLARSAGLSAVQWAEALWLAGGLAYAQGNLEVAMSFHRESVAIWRQLDDRNLAEALNSLGTVARDQCDYPKALAALEESLQLCREHDNKPYIACNIFQLGLLARQQFDCSRAQLLLEEALAIQRPLDQPRDIGATLLNLGLVAEDQGDYARAQSFYEQSIKLMEQVKDRWHLAFLFESCASVAVARGDIGRGVVLAGVAAALRREIASTIPPSTQPRMDRALALARGGLGEDGFAQAWAKGQDLTLEQAIDYALADDAD